MKLIKKKVPDSYMILINHTLAPVPLAYTLPKEPPKKKNVSFSFLFSSLLSLLRSKHKHTDLAPSLSRKILKGKDVAQRHDTPPPILPVGHRRDREPDQRQRPIGPRHRPPGPAAQPAARLHTGGLLVPLAIHTVASASSFCSSSATTTLLIQPEGAIRQHRGERVRSSCEHADGAGVGHGEAGSGEDREQSEAGGIPQPLQRGPWQGSPRLGSLGPFFLHCLLGPRSLLVCLRQEGLRAQCLFPFFLFFLYF